MTFAPAFGVTSADASLTTGASIRHAWSDGVRSVLPAASTARTSNWWLALLRPV